VRCCVLLASKKRPQRPACPARPARRQRRRRRPPFARGARRRDPLRACGGLHASQSGSRKREAGLVGERRGQMAAAVDAAGAALGALGMLAFAVAFSMLVVRSSVPTAFVGASLAWLTIAVVAWYAHRKMR